MAEMLFRFGDRLPLADLTGVCAFGTDDSIGFSLRPGDDISREIGWIDLHLTRVGEARKIYIRLCLPIPLSTRDRVDQIRRDSYAALAIPEEALFEITLFWPAKSVLYVDDREPGLLIGPPEIPTPGDVPLLDYEFVVPEEG